MIARVWRGSTLAEDAEAYAAYLEETGMKGARAIPGNRGTLVLRRAHGDYAEFETILLFDAPENIHAFAGDDLEAAVSFPRTTGISSSASRWCGTSRSTCTSPDSL